MVNQLITIGEAANLINKSAQTIRRLIKNDKIKYKRKRTPQGFNYVVDKASLFEFFQSLKNPVEVTETPIQATSQTDSETPIQPVQAVRGEGEIYFLESDETIAEKRPVNQQPQEAPPVAITQQQSSDYTNIVEKLLDQHRQDKEKLYQLLEVFQNRIVGLEEHIRLLSAPKRKWWEIWK